VAAFFVEQRQPALAQVIFRAPDSYLRRKTFLRVILRLRYYFADKSGITAK
jgi:hypothetical protein